MATIKEFEGQSWMLQSDVDAVVADRVREISAAKKAAEAAAKEAADKLKDAELKASEAEEAAAGAGALKAALDEAQARVLKAEGRYERHMALADKGITEPDIRDALLWAHDRAQEKIPAKDRQGLAEVLEAWAADPDAAPASVRPHLASLAQAEGDGDGGGDGEVAGENPSGGDAGDPVKSRGRGALPRLPTQAPDKPGPSQESMSLEEIYDADGDKLDSMIKQYRESRG